MPTIVSASKLKKWRGEIEREKGFPLRYSIIGLTLRKWHTVRRFIAPFSKQKIRL